MNLIVVPFSYFAVKASEYERDAFSDAAKLQDVLNEQEGLLNATYVGFVPQGRHYEGTERAIHLIFRSNENGKPTNGTGTSKGGAKTQV